MELTVRMCELERCRMPVFDAVHGPQQIREPFDVKPATWEEGARHRIATYQKPGAEMVRMEVVRTATGAFGVTLYQPHEYVCKQSPKRRPTTKTAGAS